MSGVSSPVGRVTERPYVSWGTCSSARPVTIGPDARCHGSGHIRPARTGRAAGCPRERRQPEEGDVAVGVEVKVENLTKRFGKQSIWEDVSLTLPAGEISVLLGPSGTGKSVFLKHLVGLLRPNRGHIWIDGYDLANCNEKKLYELRRLFGVLFQDGALFGSLNLYDNIAFPLREHTKKTEAQIREIVTEKMDMVGLTGGESELPGEISGGMRQRAGLAG